MEADEQNLTDSDGVSGTTKPRRDEEETAENELPEAKRMKTLNEGELSFWRNKLVLVMVGLPARGKSYISKKTGLYVNWLGFKGKTFNVGNQRRTAAKGQNQSADFFSPNNADAKQTREQLAADVLDELLKWLRTGGDIGIFDATNTTKERRDKILARCKQESEALNVIFIESICNDPEVLKSNFMQKIAMSPDYKDISLEAAAADLKKRIENYEKVYEPIEEDSISYMKLINLQSKVICNRIYGRVAHSISSYLMGLNIVKRKIFLCRAGKCEDRDDLNKVVRSKRLPSTSGDLVSREAAVCYRVPDLTTVLPPADMKFWSLSDRGKMFAARLRAFIIEHAPDSNRFITYSSTMPRSIETVQNIPGESQQWSALNPLDTGTLQGKSLYEISRDHPETLSEFSKDPFHYRLPGGESFEDLVHRLDPFVAELERQTNSVLVVSHLTTLQALYGYFLGCPVDRFSQVSIPQHTVIELQPNQYGWDEKLWNLGEPSDDI